MSGLYWLASYPKSGNTWVRCFLAALSAGGEMPDFAKLTKTARASAARAWIEEVLDVPTSDLTQDELVLARRAMHEIQTQTPELSRYLKVHDRYDPVLFAPEITAGIVLIVRDPRDVAPSYAEHMGVSLDYAIELMGRPGRKVADGEDYNLHASQIFSSWSDHAASWLEQSASQVLLLHYEDLTDRPVENFGRLAAFLGLKPDSDTLRLAVEATRFDVLRAREDTLGFGERPVQMNRFFRQGRAGAWSGVLTESQADRIVGDHRAMMIRLGYLPEG